MIIIFGKLVQNDDISRCFYSFSKFWFFGLLGRGGGGGGEGGCNRAKNGPKWQKMLSVELDISGTIHQMIVIYGTYV